ncbi:hypothetical protein P43SY_003550 [Pythium insidiosum]|uniref:Ankyrin repeat protein n=1 Tax=Pythium insidiosum TaxID=114742 RepID=A0AAD5LVN4_PYTIN|nr:hypothetical protein P43SY_003550 [Pythium insidiosum]
MGKVKSFMRRMLSQEHRLHLKLRKAVAQRKPRAVAVLLDAGASPTWLSDASLEAQETNALLLVCHQGDEDILNLLLNAMFQDPQALHPWGPQMFHTVIANGHWKAFRCLHDRGVPLEPTGSLRGSLPSPAFVAAEHGQSRILQFLVRKDPISLSAYTFYGHSLLSIAAKCGQYDCVQVLLSQIMVDHAMLEFAIDCARQHRQAHVLVLLTSCLPDFSAPTSDDSFLDVPFDHDRAIFSALFANRPSASNVSSGNGKPFNKLQHRGSLAETDIVDDYDDDERQRRSSAWLNIADLDAEDHARRYEEYINNATPPVSASDAPSSGSSLTKQRRGPMKWFYRNEVILPYDESDVSSISTSSATERSAVSSDGAAAPHSVKYEIVASPIVSKVSRKVISIRSNSLQSLRSLPSISE